ETVGEYAGRQPAGGGGEQGRGLQRTRAGLVEAELGADRAEGERVQHHVHRVEHPAEPGGDERAPRLRFDLAPPGRCAHGRGTSRSSQASRSASRRRAVAKSIAAMRTASRGRSWPRRGKSTVATHAITG